MILSRTRVITGLRNFNDNKHAKDYIEFLFKVATRFLLTKVGLETHKSMKTSDSDLKVNRNIYPDAVNVIGCA